MAVNMPYFEPADFVLPDISKNYLKILFSRHSKQEKILRLKKAFYVSKEYIDQTQKKGVYSDYLEFLANVLYPSSYLSLDYVLYEHNILTEIPKNFTSVSLNKTASFSSPLGHFIYHKIKKELYYGFVIEKKGEFTVAKATKAKALFDFLYFRKNIAVSPSAFRELRLNLENFNKNDLREFKKYLAKDGSKRMENIYRYILETRKT